MSDERNEHEPVAPRATGRARAPMRLLGDDSDEEGSRNPKADYEVFPSKEDPSATNLVPLADPTAAALFNKVTDSPLGKLLDHCVRAEHEFNTGDAIVTGSSLAVAGASLVLYVPLVHEYADGDLYTEIAFQIGTSGTNFLVGVYATSETLNSFRRTLPTELEDEITDKQRTSGLLWALSLMGVSTFAGIAALPFAFAAEGGIPTEAIVWGTQIFINFLGVNVVMKKQGEFILNLFASQSKREHRRVLAALRHTVEQLVAKTLSSREGIPQALTSATELTTGDAMLRLLAAQAEQFKLSSYEEPGFLDGLIDVSASLAGATLVMIGLIGYTAAMEQHLGEKISSNDKVNLPLTLLFSAPFLDLAAYFGASTLINIARVMTCSNGSPHLAFRLYKAGAPIAMLVLTGLAGFSFASAAELINKSPYFNGNGPFAEYKEAYTKFAIISSVMFNNYAVWMLMLNLLVKGTRLFGSESKKAQATYSLAMEEFLQHVEQKMSPHILAESLKKLTPDQQRSLISFNNLNYNVHTMLDNLACGPTVETPRNQSEVAPGIVGECFNWLTGRNRYMSEYQGLRGRGRAPTVGAAEEVPASYGSTVIAADPPRPTFWARAKSCLPSVPTPSCPTITLPRFKCPDFSSFFRSAPITYSFPPTVVGEEAGESEALKL